MGTSATLIGGGCSTRPLSFISSRQVRMTVLTGSHRAADEYADLEVGLHRRDAVTWTVELRFSLPRTDAETQLGVSGPLLAKINLRELDALEDEEYGLALGSGLFGHGLSTAFQT